jgi:hypothetical protein
MNEEPEKKGRGGSRKRKSRGSSSVSESSAPNLALSAVIPSAPGALFSNQQSSSSDVASRLSASTLHSNSTGIQQLESCMASSAAAARVATTFSPQHASPDVVGPWGLYGGNIAAACEAANEEVVKRRSEGTIDDEDRERKRLRDTSRLVAWQSRERKRIEIEVLQERKTQLHQLNSDLRTENEQLQSIIQGIKSVMLALSGTQALPVATSRQQPTPGMSPGVMLSETHSPNTGIAELISRTHQALASTSDQPSPVPLPFGILGHSHSRSIQFPAQPLHPQLSHQLQVANPLANLFTLLANGISLGHPSLHNTAMTYPSSQDHHQQQQQYQRLLNEQFIQQSNPGFFSAAQGILAHSLLGTNDVVPPPSSLPASTNRDLQRFGYDLTQVPQQQSIHEGSSTIADSVLMQSGGIPFGSLETTVPEDKQGITGAPPGMTTAIPGAFSLSDSGMGEGGISSPVNPSQNPGPSPPDEDQYVKKAAPDD